MWFRPPRSLLPLPLALACAVGAQLVATPARAQMPVHAAEGANHSGEAGARPHFDRALELYRAGHYAEALEQLKAAAALDPDGKDLFFNLALVHEKLGQLPQAIAALERYRELETDDGERARARLTIERLKGAQAAAPEHAAASCPSPSAPPTRPSTRPTGLLVGAASLAVVSLVVGAVFGAKALSDDIGQTGTSTTLSLGRLRERARRAEREALVADIAFAVGAASAGTFVGVWWLSGAEASPRSAGITLRSYF